MAKLQSQLLTDFTLRIVQQEAALGSKVLATTV